MLDERVEVRLRGWARWWIDIADGNEGYPKKSIISLFQEGFSLREEFKSIPLITNDKAQQMEFWLVMMGKFYPEEKEAIMFQYLSNKKPSEIAESLCISKRTFYQRVQGGKIWLSGVMFRNEG